MIEQTIRETLPEGFQRAEYLLDHGMVDMVVPRNALRDTLVRVIDLLMNKTVDPDSSPEPDAGVAAEAASDPSAADLPSEPLEAPDLVDAEQTVLPPPPDVEPPAAEPAGEAPVIEHEPNPKEP